MKAEWKKARKQKKRPINSLTHKSAISPKALLSGKWRIVEMDMCGKKFTDEDVKAHISIHKDGSGEFQFGYVNADDMNGDFINTPFGAVFDFTFLGSDECDETSGDGWINTIDGKMAEGEIRYHEGDKSGFTARKINAKRKSGKGAKEQNTAAEVFRRLTKPFRA